MTPNGHDTIQGMGPDVDVKAIKKEAEEALLYQDTQQALARQLMARLAALRSL